MGSQLQGKPRKSRGSKYGFMQPLKAHHWAAINKVCVDTRTSVRDQCLVWSEVPTQSLLEKRDAME